MSRTSELEYLNERIRTEDRMAATAASEKAKICHFELSNRYREVRRELQSEIGSMLRPRKRLELIHSRKF